ncbi:MAG: methyltransferase domain-containing protein [Lentimicrobiaceae bacterium]|nr:methyltransferase domain-containing protein [Lentimicrobiaceae bacterium]
MLKRIYKRLIPERQRINNRLLFNKMTSVLYRGNRYACNVCGKRFRKFKSVLDMGVGGEEIKLGTRENVRCPFCGSFGRSRLLLFYLQKETNIFTQKNALLHFAPEFGLQSIFKKTRSLTYVNGDYNAANADEQIDARSIPYPDQTFDYVICSHVLEYIRDDFKAMKEIRRVLKPDGTAFILSLIDWSNPHTCGTEPLKAAIKRFNLSSAYDSEWIYGADFADRLRQNGFHVEEIDYRLAFDEQTQQKYSLGYREDAVIFRCTK